MRKPSESLAMIAGLLPGRVVETTDAEAQLARVSSTRPITAR